MDVLDDGVFEVADQEETVFDHLKKQDLSKIGANEEEKDDVREHEMPELRRNDAKEEDLAYNGYHVEKTQDYEEKVNDWNVDREEESPAPNSEQTKGDPLVEVKTTWHEVAHEWGGIDDSREQPTSYEQPVPNTYPQNKFLNVRSASPDSETTGEFFTPLTTPLQSGPGTPALSDYGQSEGWGSGSISDVYEDAGEATPVQGDRTPVLELEEDGKQPLTSRSFHYIYSSYAALLLKSLILERPLF